MPCRTAAGATLVKSLSELLQAANTEGLSARSIARQAQALGYSLNHDTAARYLRGDHGRPDEDTLLALASVLKLPLAPLRKAAQLPSEVTEPYRPPPEASRLSRRQRRAVDEIIRAMLEPGRAASGEPARSKAARRGGAEPPAAH
jgi:transcriptional regulator with XRE-family HTH domain